MADVNISNFSGDDDYAQAPLERDFYGCYCLKFRIKHGSSITEAQIFRDFGAFGELFDVWGETLDCGAKYSDRLDTDVCVRFRHRSDAEEALKHLQGFYHELAPAIGDVLPDNHGLYTISFENKMAIPTSDLFHEFSKFGEIKAITGAINVSMGRVFISYWSKESSIQAFMNKTERWFLNMRFTCPRVEKDYFGTYCMKFYNTKGTPNYATDEQVREDFGRYGEVVDVRGPGLFDVAGDDVYVRYWKKTSAQTALSSLVGRYDCICITPTSDIQADKYGVYTLTYVNTPNVSEDDAWKIFSQFGSVDMVSGTFGVKTGRVFVSFKEKEGALRAIKEMLVTRQFHLQLAKSCKPVKFPKAVNNYYSAATSWSTTEFPRKRKGREEEECGDRSKLGRREEESWSKEGNWFRRKSEILKGSRESSRSSENSSRRSKRVERKPMKEKEGNLDAVEPSYNYRAPYKQNCNGKKSLEEN